MIKNRLTEEDISFRRQIHLRNLKRKLSKLSEHPEFTDEVLKIKKEIEKIESN